MGFKAFKVKVGHRDLTWDLTRLAHVVEVVGPGARLMIDANEPLPARRLCRPG
jgi:L-alanine-DL-glutamate epimerase-like enolase superfamily enzyme